MKPSFRWLLRPVVALGLLAADPARDADEAVRRGNEAFERGDFAGAAAFYGRAEERTTDPGLVAFNQAAALYRLGRYAEAEAHYRRCLDESAGERRARVLFDLGNAALQQGRDRDARKTGQAVGWYEECLRQKAAGPDLSADARFNLELARALLRKAQAAGKSGNDREEPNPENRGAEERPDSTRNPGLDVRPGGDGQPGQAAGVRRNPGDSAQAPGTSDRDPPPGQGNLPPIRDGDELTALTPEETTRYLEEVAARVARERREHRKRMTPPVGRNVMDW